ncbi:eukaryotic translation initiation factor 3 subunit J [Phlyctochytrium arcticum]|nr:eukaryotic translation initiation factor 3 subunit J [Phlyctochytrium arcticum]
MEDWENEDDAVIVPALGLVAKGSWDDEDADDDDVKESWEDSEEEGAAAKPKAETSQPVAAGAAPKKKKTLAQKIAERKEEDERKRAEFAARKHADVDEDETPEERKERLARAVVEADLENAKDLFVGTPAPSSAATESKLESMDPTTKPEFDTYIQTCMQKFSTFEGKSQYPYFVEALIRDLLVPLGVDDTRRISSSISAMINEKQKAQKAVNNKKKPKKAGLGKSAPGGALDTTNYDEVYDEFEDFM